MSLSPSSHQLPIASHLGVGSCELPLHRCWNVHRLTPVHTAQLRWSPSAMPCSEESISQHPFTLLHRPLHPFCPLARYSLDLGIIIDVLFRAQHPRVTYSLLSDHLGISTSTANRRFFASLGSSTHLWVQREIFRRQHDNMNI